MSADPASYLRALTATPTGTRIHVRVQPRASRTEIAGLHGDAVRIRLAAPPIDGAANDALLRFLAEALDVRRATIELVAGQTSRAKTILFHNLTPEEVANRLADL